MKFIDHLVRFLAGAAVSAVLLGLAYALLHLTMLTSGGRSLGLAGILGLGAAIALAVAWLYLAARGMGFGLLGTGTQLAFMILLVVSVIPGFNLIAVYWVGKAALQIYSPFTDVRTASGAKAGGRGDPRPLVNLFAAMVSGVKNRVEAGEYAEAIQQATTSINAAEETFFKNHPESLDAFGVYLVQLYTLRARARFALGRQGNDREQLQGALEDIGKGLSFPEACYHGEVARAHLEEVRQDITSSLAQA